MSCLELGRHRHTRRVCWLGSGRLPACRCEARGGPCQRPTQVAQKPFAQSSNRSTDGFRSNPLEDVGQWGLGVPMSVLWSSKAVSIASMRRQAGSACSGCADQPMRRRWAACLHWRLARTERRDGVCSSGNVERAVTWIAALRVQCRRPVIATQQAVGRSMVLGGGPRRRCGRAACALSSAPPTGFSSWAAARR
jgi:hypothetical protein